jgi:acetyltransferase-like isoleucine patch superfamily enzyme
MIRVGPVRATAMRQPNILSNDPEEVTRLWYVLPKPATKRNGWLVYSAGFLLEILQGKYGEPAAVKNTLPWRLLVGVLISFIAVLQPLLMFLSYIPVVSWFMLMLAQFFGRNCVGFFLRSCYWKTKLKKLGQCSLIDQGVEFWGAERIEIGHTCFVSTNVRFSAGGRLGQESGITLGDYVYIGPDSMLLGQGQIQIGDFVGISAEVHIYSATNFHTDPRKRGLLLSMSHSAPADRQHVQIGRVEIDEYAFVGCFGLILPGVKLGRGAIVHPYTEIRDSFPAFANVVGPGRAKQNGWRRPAALDPRISRTGLDQVASAADFGSV